jgi:formylmethanofuran dehydrogenase subunit E
VGGKMSDVVKNIIGYGERKHKRELNKFLFGEHSECEQCGSLKGKHHYVKGQDRELCDDCFKGLPGWKK